MRRGISAKRASPTKRAGPPVHKHTLRRTLFFISEIKFVFHYSVFDFVLKETVRGLVCSIYIIHLTNRSHFVVVCSVIDFTVSKPLYHFFKNRFLISFIYFVLPTRLTAAFIWMSGKWVKNHLLWSHMYVVNPPPKKIKIQQWSHLVSLIFHYRNIHWLKLNKV